jgi:hypothetical protein
MTLPDEDSSAPSTPGGKPIHIDFINPLLDIKIKHDEIRIPDERERTCSWCRLATFKMSAHLHSYFFVVLLSHVRPLTGEFSLNLLETIKSDCTPGYIYYLSLSTVGFSLSSLSSCFSYFLVLYPGHIALTLNSCIVPFFHTIVSDF